MFKKALLLFFLFSIINARAQNDSLTFFTETGFRTGLGKQTPFWQVSNNYNRYSLNKHAAFIETGIIKTFTFGKEYRLNMGIDFIGSAEKTSYARIQQAYLKLNYHYFEIKGGTYEEIFGDQDSLLSTGNMGWSGNARPMPQVSLGMTDYYPLWKGWLDFKGYFSHSWANDNIYIKDYYIHHKNLYVRLFNKFPVTFIYGLEHYAQWGGTSPKYGQLPNSFSDYYKVLSAKHGGDDSPAGEITNRLGNHLGVKNFTFYIKTKPVNYKIYWQYFFEDASYMYWENISDGLWGASFQFKNNKIVQKVVYEFVRTINQSGPIHLWNDTIHLGGNDDYYNNFIYEQGWAYNKMGIGNPLLTSPIFDKTSSIKFRNNRIIAHHIGLQGILPYNTNYKFVISYVQNLGTFSYPMHRRENISTLAELHKNFNLNWMLKISLSNDFGEMYDDNFGFLISIRRNFTIK